MTTPKSKKSRIVGASIVIDFQHSSKYTPKQVEDIITDILQNYMNGSFELLSVYDYNRYERTE